jgi:hypothetical protein
MVESNNNGPYLSYLIPDVACYTADAYLSRFPSHNIYKQTYGKVPTLAELGSIKVQHPK